MTTKVGNIKDSERPLAVQILLFVLPVIATSVLHSLFNTADTYMVGNFGGASEEECQTALAAVGSCSSLINLLVNFFMTLSLGAGVTVAQSYGAKNYDVMRRAVPTAVIIGGIFGVVVMVTGELFAEPLLVLMGTTPSALPQAVLYMKAYFLGIPASLIYNYAAACLRSTGDTTHPLVFLTAGGVCNVIFNFITVVGFGMGALGVGLATAVSQVVSCILVLIHLFRGKGMCKLAIKELKIDFPVLKKMLIIGIPAGIQSVLFSISNVMIQASVNSFGSEAVVAGNTSAGTVGDYVYVIQNGFYQGALTFTGQFFGARRPDKIKKATLWCLFYVTAFGLFFGTLANVFAVPLLSIFLKDSAAIEVGVIRLLWIVQPYFLCGVMEVGSGVLRGLGKSTLSMIIALLGSCAFRILWITLVFSQHHTLPWLYVSYAISWIVTSIVYYIFAFVNVNKYQKRFAAEDAMAR